MEPRPAAECMFNGWFSRRVLGPTLGRLSVDLVVLPHCR